AMFLDDFGVYQHQLGFGIFLESNVDHGDAFADADLRSGEPHAVRGIHGFEHVVHQLLQSVIKLVYSCRGCLQNRITIFHDGIDHFPRQNARSCCLYPSKLRRVSVGESPPNFSRAQRASVSATMASAATPAAGTTQTSERSCAALTGSRVSKSTDRNGRRKVEMGFR